jgi:uncharacterized protein (DUF362 family)
MAAGVGCGSDSKNATAGGSGATTGAGGFPPGAGGAPQAGSGTGAAGGNGPIGNGLVAMVRSADWAQATMDAITGAGGLPDLTGKTVVIRPNVIEAQADGTTSPEVIRGVIRAAKAKGASSIVVAEDSFNGNCLPMMQTLGITAVCTAEGATTTNLNGTATTNRKPANAAAWGNGIDFYDLVYNADYVINVPKCKTHSGANFSLALKAWFGSLNRVDIHTQLANKAAEAHLARKEDLVVIDATRCMVTGGPGAGGTMKDSQIVVASKDAIAADITGLAIIRYFGGTGAATSVRNTLPWNQAMIQRALALAIPGWLTAQTDFSYTQSGVTEHADIMAKRTA